MFEQQPVAKDMRYDVNNILYNSFYFILYNVLLDFSLIQINLLGNFRKRKFQRENNAGHG